MAKNVMDEIKQILKEQRSRTALLEAPEDDEMTKLNRMSKGGKTIPNQKTSSEDPTVVQPISQERPSPGQKRAGGRGGDTQVDTERPFPSEKDLRPGLNAYHGILTQFFGEVQKMQGTGADLIKKVTTLAIHQLGQSEPMDQETSDVFGSSGTVDPKKMAAIVQKAMLVALHHVAQEAAKESMDNGTYQAATAE